MNARRDVLRNLALAATAGVLRIRPTLAAAAEPPPETRTLRLGQLTGICIAPQYIAEEFLHGEGFTQVQYVKEAGRVATNKALASGDISITAASLGPLLVQIDAGDPITLVSGLHVGCFALFATERIRTLRDLKGKTVSVTELGTGRHVFLAAAMAYVGLDPRFNIAYRFGAVFLAEAYPGGPGRPDLAVALLEKGLRARPDKWEYMEDIGFVHYWYLHDYGAAASWFDKASRAPGAPWWLRSLAATTLAQGGDRQSSRTMWEAIRQSAENDWLRARLRTQSLSGRMKNGKPEINNGNGTLLIHEK